MANIIKFDYDNNLILDKIIEQPLVVGQSNFYNFIVGFYSDGNLMWDDTWKAVVVFERPDGERSNELLLTRSGPFYEKKIAAWVSDVEGDLKVAVRIKSENNDVIQAFPLVIFEVEEGLKPSGDTIEEAQYQGIIDDINRINNSVEDLITSIDTYDRETIDEKNLETLNEAKGYADRLVADISVTGHGPDGVTIILNEEEKLKVSEDLKIDGGYL